MFNKKFDNFVDWFAHLKREIDKNDEFKSNTSFLKGRFFYNLDKHHLAIESEFKLVQQKKVKEHDFYTHVLDVLTLVSSIVKLQWSYFSMAEVVNKIDGRIKFKLKIISDKKMIIQIRDRNLKDWFDIVKKIALFHIDRLGFNEKDYNKEFAELEIEKRFHINNRTDIVERYFEVLRSVNNAFERLLRIEDFKLGFVKDLLRIKPKEVKNSSIQEVNKGFNDFFKGLTNSIEYLKGTDYVEDQDDLIVRMKIELISKRPSYHKMFYQNDFQNLKSHILYLVKHYVDHEYFVADVEIYLNKALGLK